MDNTTVRTMLAEIGVPQCYEGLLLTQDILCRMEDGVVFEGFGSPFRSCIIHDGEARHTEEDGEFIAYEIVGASYIIQFGRGTDGIHRIYIYPHCNPTKLRSVLEPLVATWQQRIADARIFNALSPEEKI